MDKTNTTIRLGTDEIEALRAIALGLGIAHKGQGNISGLLAAIAAGEVKVSLAGETPDLSPRDRESVAAHLGSIAQQVQAMMLALQADV